MITRKRPTRRRKALRWLFLLVLLTAFLTFHGQYHFFLIQGIRDAERQGGIGPTKLVAELPGDEDRRDERHQVRANENGMMVASFRIMSSVSTTGWGAWYAAYLDCTDPAPFHAGFFIFANSAPTLDENYKTWADHYGRIDDPEAAAVRLDVYRNGHLQETHTIGKEKWIQVDGRTYFVLEFPWDPWYWKNLENGWVYSQLLDEEGHLLAGKEFALGKTKWGLVDDILSLGTRYQ